MAACARISGAGASSPSALTPCSRSDAIRLCTWLSRGHLKLVWRELSYRVQNFPSWSLPRISRFKPSQVLNQNLCPPRSSSRLTRDHHYALQLHLQCSSTLQPAQLPGDARRPPWEWPPASELPAPAHPRPLTPLRCRHSSQGEPTHGPLLLTIRWLFPPSVGTWLDGSRSVCRAGL